MDKFFDDIVEISDDSFIVLNDLLGLFVFFLELFLKFLDLALFLD